MKINELDLHEIERLGAGGYRGGKSYLYGGRDAKSFKPLPGGSGLLYTIENIGNEPIIKLWDPNGADVSSDTKPKREYGEFPAEFRDRLAQWEKRRASGEKIPQIIGKLSLEAPYNFPLKNALQVSTITIDEDYRGGGLAKALYGIVLTIMKRPLVAGSSQTPGGRRNWVSLASIPGVEMKGFIEIRGYDLNTNPKLSRSRQHTKQAEQNIDVIMGQLGGQYIGMDDDYHFFAFDVQPNTTGKELEAYVKQKLVGVYGGKTAFSGGLYAVWTGQQ